MIPDAYVEELDHIEELEALDGREMERRITTEYAYLLHACKTHGGAVAHEIADPYETLSLIFKICAEADGDCCEIGRRIMERVFEPELMKLAVSIVEDES